ncbi:MAG: hypothetical protein II604_05810 [Bacteroidales bacterium]|nr:hypothetical protein [Bacteroidales bacterium]
METKSNIESLLIRFYDGKTTPEEEEKLMDFFRSDDVPAELEADRKLFLSMSEIADTHIPDDIATEINAFVGNLNDSETEKNPELASRQPKSNVFRQEKPPKTIWYRIAAAVSVIAIVGICIMQFQNQESNESPFRDTCASVEEAAMQIERANSIISRSIQMCKQPAQEAIQKTNSKINKIKNQSKL